MNVDFNAAIRSPTSVFHDPREIVGHEGLSREQKLRILKQWEVDARALAVAEEEGMAGGEPNMLQRVMQALDDLNALPVGRGGAGTKQGY